MGIIGRRKGIKFMRKIIKVVIQNTRNITLLWGKSGRVHGSESIDKSGGWSNNGEQKWNDYTKNCWVSLVPSCPLFPPFPIPPTPSTPLRIFRHSYIDHIHYVAKAFGSWKKSRILCKFNHCQENFLKWIYEDLNEE